MQPNAVAWVGNVKLLLEDVDGRISPGGRACEHVLDDLSDVGFSEIRAHGLWKILDPNRAFDSILVGVVAGKTGNLVTTGLERWQSKGEHDLTCSIPLVGFVR